MNSPLTSLTNHQEDTDTDSFVGMFLLFQSGLYVILGLFTIMLMTFGAYGDSTIQKKDAITPLSTPPSKVIK
jgi:hypothetical protein